MRKIYEFIDKADDLARVGNIQLRIMSYAFVAIFSSFTSDKCTLLRPFP